MNTTAFPIQRQGGFSPMRRSGFAVLPNPARSGPRQDAARRIGQAPEAAALARGADITFSVLTSGAAVVSGITLMTLVGMSARDGGEGYLRAVGGRQGKTAWAWIGGIIAILGAANAFVSLSRAAATQAPTAPPPMTSAPTITQSNGQ